MNIYLVNIIKNEEYLIHRDKYCGRVNEYIFSIFVAAVSFDRHAIQRNVRLFDADTKWNGI